LDIIDYKQLVAEYNKALVNVLRGFRSKYEFLDIWVPDAEPYRSIINLLEAAQIEAENEVSLLLDQQTLDGLDLNALIQQASELGQVNTRQTEQGLIFHVSGLIGDHISHQSEAKLEDFNPLYRTKLMELGQDIQHEHSLADDEAHLLIHANHQGTSLFAHLDVQQHRLIQASFAGTSSAIEKGLLEALCRLIEGLPIQEIYDHGLLKLEYALRDHNQALPVNGIINIFNFDPIFQLPQNLIRQLFHIYEKQTGYQAQLNDFDSLPHKDWLKLNDEQKIEKLQKFLDELLSLYQYRDLVIKVKYLEKTVKVHIEIQGEISTFEKAALMLNMEKDLHNQVESKLQLYLEPSKDINKLRETKLKNLN
jgi:hypothetical protein